MEHPFAPFIQFLGKGRRGARNLTQEEARRAMEMILAGEVEPIQLGAFLMLMRVKEETAEEVAGFVQAARDSRAHLPSLGAVDLDWASYAGKRRQLPWNLLSALLLASHGTTVLMHGVDRGVEGRLYLPQALAALGLSVAGSLEQAKQQLATHRFSFVPTALVQPEMDRMLNLKSVLGLRSPIHTVVRMLNPGRAATSIMGIFHPGYDQTHQQAALLLGDRNLAVFKGEGGEAECNPDGACLVKGVRNGQAEEVEWPAQFNQRHLRDEVMDPLRLKAVWTGEAEDEYGVAAIIATTAIALYAMERAADAQSALATARQLWNERDRSYLERAGA
jgi:anthranilate phosphoribosyltransferase